MKTIVFLLATVLAVLPRLHAATLRIVEADVPGGPASWRTGPTLPTSTTLCPASLPPLFSIECLADAPATSARFFVNGVFLRRENVQPYILSGDVAGVAKPWTPPEDVVRVRCVLANGERVFSRIRFACDDDKSATAPTVPPAVAPPSPTPSSTPAPPVSTAGGAGDGSCVKIGALSYESKSGMWTVEGAALAYKKDDSSTGVDSPDNAVLEYKFVALVTSRYAFTLDMETGGGVDHNDVWVEFSAGGFSLERADGSTKVSSGWTKAYHNKNGRAVLAFSVDFNPHSMSTKEVLNKGVTYSVRVAGRSTKVLLYSVVMFPCSGEQCVIGTYWNQQAAKCS